jgi:hypothetical protein
MAKVKKEEPSLTVNGIKYLFADLSEDAKKKVLNIQAADAELQPLHIQQALMAALPAQP